MKRLFHKTFFLNSMNLMEQYPVKNHRGYNQLTTFVLLLITVISLTDAAFATVKSDQRKVQKEIKQLSQQIGTKKKESDSLNSQVTKLEKELGILSIKQHKTEGKIKETKTRLLDADAQKSELDIELKQQHAALAQQLQAMHTAGEQSHLRLLLLQDNPSDISRNIQYFDYLNRYRSTKISEINEITAELENATRAAKKERDQLRGLQAELKQQKQQVEIKLASRETAFKKVSLDLNSKKKRMNKLAKQEKALQREIERLARQEAKKRAAAEAAKKRAAVAARKEAKRKAAAQQRKQQRAAADKKRKQQKRPTASVQKKSAPAQRRTTQKPAKPTGRKVTTTRTPNKAFSKLRGKLSWPVSGRVIYKYNSRRNEKQRWRGVVIAAPGGAKVKAVAPGKVVFAGWMNGYGHLIIIEHDRNYMSLYGYNRAVFKRVGHRVKANETIAAVGNSSGQSRNALYFEIRRKTVPQNPARWLR